MEKVTEVKKRGEWYTVKGSQGTSIDIPANQIDSRKEKDARALMERGLRTAQDSARD